MGATTILSQPQLQRGNSLMCISIMEHYKYLGYLSIWPDRTPLHRLLKRSPPAGGIWPQSPSSNSHRNHHRTVAFK